LILFLLGHGLGNHTRDCLKITVLPEIPYSHGMAKVCISTLTVLLLAAVATADDRVEALDEVMSRYHELGQFNGTALIVEKGDALLRKSYGFADQENELANKPELSFAIGSISKSFTSSLVLQLIDDGILDPDKTVEDYLPYYRPDTASDITLRHLLTHTDGLSNYTNNPDYWQPYDGVAPLSTREFIQTYCSSDLEFVPGSEYRYGNSGYSILGAIIEEVSGKPFAQVLQERVIGPLGMPASGDMRAGMPDDGLAKGYQIGPNGYRLAAPIHKPLFAAGSMYASADDLLSYAQSLDYESLVSRITDGIVDGTFAYGWTVGEYSAEGTAKKSKLLSTNGEVNGYNALLVQIVETERTIILLSNTGETDLSAMAGKILQLLNGERPELPSPRTRDAFYLALQEQGVAAAIQVYRSHRTDNPDDYIYFRWPLRILAQQLLDDQRYEDAIQFLELNLETHPDDARTEQMLEEARRNSLRSNNLLANPLPESWLSPSSE
jgi:CubicO group peptidase (beta-lactamase class C family)